jgi:thiol-disulfide isomerase/thioredoxin
LYFSNVKWLCTLIFSALLISAQAQTAKYQRFSELDSFLNNTNDTLYIINLWATWCKPCIEELPYFEQVNTTFANKNVRVILLSVDAESRWESNLEPFLKNKTLTCDVWSIYKDKPADWIDKIEPSWQGTIPGTLMFNNARQISYFHDREITYEELTLKINELLNK